MLLDLPNREHKFENQHRGPLILPSIDKNSVSPKRQDSIPQNGRNPAAAVDRVAVDRVGFIVNQLRPKDFFGLSPFSGEKQINRSFMKIELFA